MSDLDSNIDAIDRLIDQVIAGFNFTLPGQDQSLGRDLVNTVAQGIIDRSIPDAHAPDGSPWDKNEPVYARRKRRKYDANQPNVRTGQMLSLASVTGQPAIGPDQVAMRYGLGVPPAAAANGTVLTEADKRITDIEKAFFGAADRPFFALDDTIKGAVSAAADAALDDYLN